MAERRPPAFRNLLAYQVSSTADALRRSAAMRMRREHDVSLAQVRTLALIDHLQPVRLRDVAADAGADKAQISRVVSSLVSRGYVTRRALVGDARSAHLELTQAGRDKVAGLFRTLQDRDRLLKAGFQPAEIEQLLSLLARVRKVADQLSLDEERLANGNSSAKAA
ncbi:MarR family winged helix-turn-helix transcriptional regulator [Ramlibacter sp. PS4R-6]|uniref:MarR family winged helix-turn-helix transcriptional regulator n=1 Tax=Ramlibacter sp. PS4R-6 TaxID=3133438 RepID=UPI0030998EAC